MTLPSLFIYSPPLMSMLAYLRLVPIGDKSQQRLFALNFNQFLTKSLKYDNMQISVLCKFRKGTTCGFTSLLELIVNVSLRAYKRSCLSVRPLLWFDPSVCHVLSCNLKTGCVHYRCSFLWAPKPSGFPHSYSRPFIHLFIHSFVRSFIHTYI